jgi:hypothetical protein
MNAASTRAPSGHRPSGRAEDLVRWGPVVAGVVVGLGGFALLDALWFAVAAGGGNGWVTGNLEWFVGGTGIGALLVAGFVAGLLSGSRGAGAGIANGCTAWGLLVVLSLVGGIPGALGLSGALDLGLTARQALWTLFWSLLVGLASAALGGLLGGLVRRPLVVAGVQSRDESQRSDEVRTGEARTTVLTGNRAVDERTTAPQDRTADSVGAGSRRV